MKVINSIQNDFIKNTAKLYEPKERKASGLFLIEGLRELNLAVKNKIKFETLFFCPELISEQDLPKISAEIISVNQKVFERLTYRGSSGGLLAVAKQPNKKLDQLSLNADAFIVVLEKMEKPGNVGAILRTADAAGVDTVLVCDEVSDLYNPNCVRASLGALFSVPTIACSSIEAIEWLQKNKIKIFAATPHTKKSCYGINYKQKNAIVIGSEKDGLTEQWLTAADEKILIPMQGQVDSLNAATSATILIYEAVRQRTKI